MTVSRTILITAAGAPQSPTLIRHLKDNADGVPVRIVALDMNPEAVGRFFADGFHVIPEAGANGYRERILEIVEAERADAFLNVSGNDVPFIARLKPEIEATGTVVLCCDADVIDLVNDKYRLYETFRDDPGVSIPDFHWPKSLDEFIEIAAAMGYPDRDICFKPHVSKGSRGFRILSERFDRRDLLLNYKPISRYMTLDDFVSIFRGHADFPKLMLMELAEGEEIDAMTIGWEGNALLTTCKSRESNRWGVIDLGAHVDRPEIVKSVAAICRRVPLRFNNSLQFIGGKLIEINPRTSTFIYQDDLNEPWLALKLAMGMIGPDDVREFQPKVSMGRRMVRYMDQIFFDPDGTWQH
ncbi:MAG: hypothetical protein RLW62_20900 [Gammaproteobacteria bacterium]